MADIRLLPTFLTVSCPNVPQDWDSRRITSLEGVHLGPTNSLRVLCPRLVRMSTHDSQRGPGRSRRRKSEDHEPPAAFELDAAQEAELWKHVEKRGEAVQTLAQAKLMCLGHCLQGIDSSPLTFGKLESLIALALRRAIEKPRVDEVLGAILPSVAHEALCDCATDALQRTTDEAGSEAPDPAEWLKTRIPRDSFENALKAPCDGEDGLWQAIRRGRKAFESLVVRYTRLAKHLARARRGGVLSLDDLESVAMEGLCKAVDRFNLEKGNQFSTFATPIIANEIKTAFRNAPTTGSHHARQAAAYTECRQKLTKALARPPSDAEVFHALGWSERVAENFASGKVLLGTKRLDRASDKKRSSIIDRRARKPLDDLVTREDLERLYAALDQLEARFQHVINRIYLDQEPMSQQAVADELGITRDQVRTIIDNARTALKNKLEETEVAHRHAD
jgi:RNA polymerase sigma-B factor